MRSATLSLDLLIQHGGGLVGSAAQGADERPSQGHPLALAAAELGGGASEVRGPAGPGRAPPPPGAHSPGAAAQPCEQKRFGQ